MSTKIKNGPGLIDYTENKQKGHKMISNVYNDKLKEFVPEFKLKRTKPKVEEAKVHVTQDVSYPMIEVEEVYLLGKNLEKINLKLKEPVKMKFYGIKEVREIINSYVAENELEQDVKRGHIKLDPIIVNMVGGLQPEQREVKKEFLFKNLQTNLLNYHTITLIDEKQIVKER